MLHTMLVSQILFHVICMILTYTLRLSVQMYKFTLVRECIRFVRLTVSSSFLLSKLHFLSFWNRLPEVKDEKKSRRHSIIGIGFDIPLLVNASVMQYFAQCIYATVKPVQSNTSCVILFTL